MSAVEVHPEVRRALDNADAVRDRLRAHIDAMRALTGERLSEDRDIAVKVDMAGTLTDLWLKPGLLDRTSAREVARQVTGLVTAAAEEVAADVERLYREAHGVVSDEEEAPPGGAVR